MTWSFSFLFFRCRRSFEPIWILYVIFDCDLYRDTSAWKNGGSFDVDVKKRLSRFACSFRLRLNIFSICHMPLTISHLRMMLLLSRNQHTWYFFIHLSVLAIRNGSDLSILKKKNKSIFARKSMWFSVVWFC